MPPSHLSPGFTFSQASLQDYSDCARRFQLRYVLAIRWPQAKDEPATERERRMQQGAAFHYLVHQHALGIPVDVLDPIADQDTLRHWWRAYLNAPPNNLPSTVYRTEVQLAMPIGILFTDRLFDPDHPYRLAARYDLLAIDPGRHAVIVDWKTGTKRPKRIWLESRWQTLVYRYVLAYAGTHLNNNVPIHPEQIEMVYWFADFPAQPERLEYDTEQHKAAAQALTELITEIETREGAEWPLADDERKCKYCTYRTLCGRQSSQAEETPEELEIDPFDFELDLEQIAEIAF